MMLAVAAFTYAWLGWGAIFASIEGLALYVDHKRKTTGVPGKTLSALLWRFSDAAKHPINRIILSVVMVDLTSHFLFRTSLLPFIF